MGGTLALRMLDGLDGLHLELLLDVAACWPPPIHSECDEEILEAMGNIKPISSKDSRNEKKLKDYIKLLSKELNKIFLFWDIG